MTQNGHATVLANVGQHQAGRTAAGLRDRCAAHGRAACTCVSSAIGETQGSATQTGAKPSEATSVPLVLFSLFAAVQCLDKYVTARVDGREVITPLRLSRTRLAEPRAIPMSLTHSDLPLLFRDRD